MHLHDNIDEDECACLELKVAINDRKCN